MVDAAVAIECETGTGDRIEGRRRHILHLAPGCVATLERRLADSAIRFAHERATLRHRQALSSAVGPDHIELQLARNRVVHSAPGVQAVDTEIRREPLLGGPHRALRLFAQPTQEILTARQLIPRCSRSKVIIGCVLEGPLEFNSELFRLRENTRERRFFTLVRLIPCIMLR